MTIHAIAGLARFTLRRLVAGRKVPASMVVLALAPLTALLLAAFSTDTPAELYDRAMIQMAAYLSPLLLALIHSVAMTSGEIEDGTAPMVLLSGLPKWLATLVQGVTAAAALSLALAATVALTWGIARMGGAGERPAAVLIWRYSFAVSVAMFSYLSIFVFLGYAFRHGLAAGITYAVIWEAMVIRMPIRFAAFTVTNNVRALIVSLGLEGERGEHFGYAVGYDFPTYGQAALFLSIAVAAALTLGMVAAMNRSLVSRG